MNDRPVRFALLGCGRVTQHYIYLLTDKDPVAGCQIVGCCDLDSTKAAATGKAFGCDVFQDALQMINETKPDIVVILTPSGDHFEHAKLVLEQGCSVLVEKPITLIPEQAYELTKMATDKGLSYSGIFQNRYNPAIQKTKDAMSKGRFGKIVTASIRLRWCRYQDYYEDEWHGTWAQDGGVINQQAIHHVDALNLICGPVEAVTATMGNRANQLEAEDTLCAVLRFQNGAMGTIEATTAARPEDIEASLSIVGEKGMVQVGGLALNKIDEWRFIEELPEDSHVKERYSNEVPTGYGLSHSPLLRDVIESFNAKDRPMPIDGHEAVKAVEVVHAIYSSIEQGGWTLLADGPRSNRLGIR